MGLRRRRLDRRRWEWFGGERQGVCSYAATLWRYWASLLMMACSLRYGLYLFFFFEWIRYALIIVITTYYYYTRWIILHLSKLSWINDFIVFTPFFWSPLSLFIEFCFLYTDVWLISQTEIFKHLIAILPYVIVTFKFWMVTAVWAVHVLYTEWVLSVYKVVKIGSVHFIRGM